MPGRLEAFSEGIKVKWESLFGSEAEISVKKPSKINEKQFREFLLNCKEECSECVFLKNKFCTGLDEDGVARVEVRNNVVNDELERNNVPCSKNGIKCNPF